MWAQIKASIGLDATGFEAGAKRVESATARMSGQIGSRLKGAIAGAFSLGAITAFSKAASDAANRIKDLSDQSGLTTDQVQELDFAAKQVGSSFDNIAGSIDKLSKARQSALDGNSGLIGAFSRLGIGMQDLQDESKGTLELFQQIADSGVDLGRNDLMEIFGKTGGQLASVLESIREQSGKGVFFSKDDIDSIDAFTESIANAKEQVMGFWAGIITGVAINPLGKFTDHLSNTKAAIERMRDKYGTAGMLGKIVSGNELSQTREQVIADQKASTEQAPRALTINEQRGALLNQMAADAKKSFPGQAAENARLAALDPMKLFAASGPAMLPEFSGKSDGFQADSLARVGGFVGGAGSYDPSLTVATESFRVLQSIDRHLQDIKQANGAPNGNLNNQFAN